MSELETETLPLSEPPPLLWGVAHAKPRCEKQIAKYCEDNQIHYELPTYKSLRSYPSKKVVFYKPYFPGYVFIRATADEHIALRGCRYIARMLKVTDQVLFKKQLEAVLTAIHSDIEFLPVPQIKVGVHVKIKSGKMQGIEGIVQKRSGLCKVFLSMDFLGCGVEGVMDANNLEVIE